MKCPKCGSTQNKTADSRYTDNDSKRRRRRECNCGHRFTTIEILNEDYIKLTAENNIKDYSSHIERIAQIVNEKPL